MNEWNWMNLNKVEWKTLHVHSVSPKFTHVYSNSLDVAQHFTQVHSKFTQVHSISLKFTRCYSNLHPNSLKFAQNRVNWSETSEWPLKWLYTERLAMKNSAQMLGALLIFLAWGADCSRGRLLGMTCTDGMVIHSIIRVSYVYTYIWHMCFNVYIYIYMYMDAHNWYINEHTY